MQTTPILTRCAAPVVLLAALLLAGEAPAQSPAFAYPETRREPLSEVIFGEEVRDPYRWLEVNDSAEVQAWAEAQDALTRDYLEGLSGRDGLEARLTELIDLPWVGAPWIRNGRQFYYRRLRGKDKSVLFWRDGEAASERVLIDPNALGTPSDNISLGNWSITRDGRTLAYTLKANNADAGTIQVMDVESGRVSPVDRLEGIKSSRIEWTLDGSGFYYTLRPDEPEVPENERPGRAEVRFHKLGTPQSEDLLVFPRTNDPATWIRPRVSWDGRWLFIYIWRGHERTTVYLRDLQSEDGAFRLFYEAEGSRIWVFDHGDSFYILSDEGAPNKKLLRAPAGVSDQAAWETVVPESAEALLDHASVAGGRLLLRYLEKAWHKLQIHELDGRLVKELTLPAPGSVRWIRSHPEHDEAYFTFSSYSIPWRTYRVSAASGEVALWQRVEVPVDPAPYRAEQIWYRSKDGTAVPMMVVHRKDLPLDGSTPFLLYGYGGFNSSLYPSFFAQLYAWLEAGGGYAVPNLRGGGEFGKRWHRAGMGAKKQNVFDDFIAAAETLISRGYTRPERLAIRGRSNGGLLVGAAMTQRPELFGAAISGVPLTDMVRYTQLGVGKLWIPEYGSPEDQAAFTVLYGYSPYHRVKPGRRYPPTLVTTADTDDRVHPGHARKFAAALQAAAQDNVALFSIERQAGHGGADRIDARVRRWADEFGFLMTRFGMTR